MKKINEFFVCSDDAEYSLAKPDFCNVTRGTVHTLQDHCIIFAVGPNTSAYADNKNCHVYASNETAFAYADCENSSAYALTKGSTAHASVSGSASYATCMGSIAISTNSNARAHQFK